MAQTIDEVTRDVLASTSSVLQCSNGTNSGTPTELSKADLDAAIKTLLGNDAEMISEVITGTDAFATSPVRPSFMGYIDTDLLDDLENVSNFLSSANYPNNQRVMDDEWGSTSNIRWLYTSVGSVSNAATPVYNNFIIGKEAYAVVHLGSERGKFYVEPLGSAGSADPLHQRGSVGWEHPFVARILNDAFMLNLTATHS
jgi:N4-gp56 family major capsid protein